MPDEVLLDAELMDSLEQLELVSRRVLLGRHRGERRSRRKGSGFEFADYRDYAQGDDLRRVDWNLLGRLDMLFLKLFHEEEDLTLAIWIDASKSMGFGTPQKLLYAKRLAAALAYVALCGMDRVVIETAKNRCRPMRGKQSLGRILDFLSGIPCEGETDLDASLKDFALRHGEPGVRVVISDFLDKAGYDAALQWIRRGSADPVLLHILSPQEVEPDFVGDLMLVDSEDGSQTEVSITSAVLRRYRRTLQGFCAGLRDACRARGMQYLFLKTDVPLSSVVMTSLRTYGVVR